MLAALLEGAAAAPRPLLRVPGPRGARLLEVPRSRSIRPTTRRSRAQVRRRRREVLRDDGRDRRRDDGRPRAGGRADRPVGPRLRDVAAFGQLQLLARRERLPRPEGRRAPAEPRGALLARAVLGGRGLVASRARTRWAWATSTSTCRGARRTGSSRRAPTTRRCGRSSSARLTGLTDPKNGRAGGLAGLQARGRLPPFRSASHSGPDRDEPPRLPRLLAGVARRPDRDRLRGQPRRLERRPLLARPGAGARSLLRVEAASGRRRFPASPTSRLRSGPRSARPRLPTRQASRSGNKKS